MTITINTETTTMRTTTSRRSALALALSVALAPACGDDESASASATEGATDTDADTSGDTDGAALTYWQEVAPIYFDRCVACHQAGGIAPFALDNYADAKTWGPASAAATAARTMPPWLVRDDGTCGDFAGSRALAEDEIAAIGAWVDGGMAEGTPRDDLAIPQVDALKGTMTLKTPTFAPEIAGGPLAEFDEYRCFLVDPGLDADAFLTAYDVHPGTPSIVHHVLAMPIDPSYDVGGGMTNLDLVEALDAESPDREGWPCFGAAGDGVEVDDFPVVWAPGQGVVRYPEGTGVRLHADDLVVIQVHYNMDRPELLGLTDTTEVELVLADEVETEGHYLALDLFLDTLGEDTPATLPAGEAHTTYTWEVDLGAWAPYLGWSSVNVRGLFPHMHDHGQTMRVEIDPDGAGYECAADVPRWDFNWQLQYFLDQPLTLNEAGMLRVTCGYNTEAAEGPVLPGWGTGNEMCFLGLFVTP
ncbi:MAG: hypothetical protein KC420_11895 [Myxococcales bacterium]|nr:hypothetical protein [Myxococcales bacterium]MCB9700489.1 hypothetical protein [Myxococcales bacterium]